MLPDILFEAIQDIEYYQETHPELYEQYRKEIDTLKDLMRHLQKQLETTSGGLPVPLPLVPHNNRPLPSP
jgi:hypothetical protein